jgi:hypothetical protein
MKWNFKSPPQKIDEIYNVLQQSRLAACHLKKFFEKLNLKQVQVQWYPPELSKRLREATPDSEPIGAVTISSSPDQHIIYLDSKSPLGVLSPFLFHEIVHCLDEDYLNGIWSKRTERQKQRLILLAECHAYRLQRKFIAELTKSTPAYEDFLKTKKAQSRLVRADFSQKELESLYCA